MWYGLETGLAPHLPHRCFAHAVRQSPSLRLRGAIAPHGYSPPAITA